MFSKLILALAIATVLCADAQVIQASCITQNPMKGMAGKIGTFFD